MSDNLIIYHNACFDGLASAVAAMLRLNDPQANCIGWDYNWNFLPGSVALKDKHIMIVDFSFGPEQLAEMAQYAKSITMIDHHQSAADKWVVPNIKEILKNRGLPDGMSVSTDSKGKVNKFYKTLQYSSSNGRTVPITVKFDMNYCGAYLMWMDNNPDLDIPYFFKLINDYDMYHKKLNPTTDQLNAWLSTWPMNPKFWLEKYNYLALDNSEDDMITYIEDHGQPILDYIETICDKLYTENKQYAMVEFHNYPKNTAINALKVVAVNAPYFYASKIGERIYTNNSDDIAMIYNIYKDPKLNTVVVRLNFRSSTRNTTEYSALYCAKLLGGGGHQSAAGATLSLADFENIIHVY